MPYDITGRGITQEEKLRQQYWEANHEKRIKIGVASFLVLVTLVFLAGAAALIGGVIMLASSEDVSLHLLGIAFGIILTSLAVMAALWARF